MSASLEELTGPVPPAGRGRRPRHRALWAGAVVLTLVVGAFGWHRATDDGWPGGYGHWTQDVTRGDLAGDSAAVASVLDAWHASRGLTDDTVVTTRLLEAPIDEPRVVWISRVDGEVTAVVRQQVALTHDRYRDEDIYGTEPGYVFGFLRGGTDGMRIRTVRVEWGSGAVFVVLGAWVSQDPPIALVLDVGRSLRVSTAPPGWTAEGMFEAPFHPLRFDEDGVAVIRPGAGEDPADLRVGLAESDEGAYGLVGQRYRDDPEPLTTWQAAQPREEMQLVPIAGLHEAAESAGIAFNAFVVDDLLRDPDHSLSTGPWVLAGTIEDDFPVTVGPYSIDGGWRLGLVYGAWGHTRARDAGPLDADSPLPVAVRLPDARGWVVAAPRAELAYRAPGSTRWVEAGSQAALLPDADSWEVRVTTPSGQQVVTPTAARLSP